VRPLEIHRAVLKPDAIVEVSGGRRRMFLEAETSQGIATKNPARTGPHPREAGALPGVPIVVPPVR
jgi:hypothetical protein